MYSKTATGKTPKGSVTIINPNGRLQLRFRYAGKRYYAVLGLPDTKANRKLAEVKKTQIELDIASAQPNLKLYPLLHPQLWNFGNVTSITSHRV